MRTCKQGLMLVCLVLGSSAGVLAAEGTLQEALDAANQGRTQEAITRLEKLKSASPSNPQIYLSLGLIYQSTDQYDLAIRELETSQQLKSSLDASYALGLLYEAKLLNGDDSALKQKAIQTWKNVELLAVTGDNRRVIAQTHIERLAK